MNKQGNLYTIIYIVVLVVLVGTALAFTAITLKPRQQANADAAKMRQILASVNIYPEKDRIIEDYNKYITDSYIVDSEGNRVDDGTEAFSVNVAAESKTDAAERLLPVYVCTLGDGSQKKILLRDSVQKSRSPRSAAGSTANTSSRTDASCRLR